MTLTPCLILVMSIMGLADTYRGFIGTSVMTQALMKDDNPDEVTGNLVPGKFGSTMNSQFSRKVSFSKTQRSILPFAVIASSL